MSDTRIATRPYVIGPSQTFFVVPSTAAGGDTLLGYWPMTEGSGVTFTDTVAARNMTINDPGGSWTGSSGYAFFTNGNAFTTSSNDGSVFTGLSSFTVFCWAAETNVSQPNGNAWVSVYDFGANKRAWAINNTPGSGVVMRVSISQDGTSLSSLNSKQYDGSQTFINGSNNSFGFRWSAGTLDLFVNGVLDTSVTKTFDASFSTVFASSGVPLALNAVYSSGTISGTLESTAVWRGLRIYGNALSSATIATLHSCGPN